MWLNTRSRIESDIGADFAKNRTQEVMQNLARKFSIVNLQAPWNAGMKNIAGRVTMTRMIEAILVEGRGKLKPAELKFLEFAKLTPDIRRRIRLELEQPGGMSSEGPLKWSNTSAWEDLAAAQEFSRAVRMTVDNTILTPGVGAVPLWLNKEEMRTIFQFQRFSFGATSTILMSGLQTRDMATLNGILMSVTLGMLVEWIKNAQNERPNPESFEEWVKSGIDRSGVTGIGSTAWHMSSKIFGGEGPSSRFAARNLTSSLLGPTLGTVESGFALTGSLAKGEFSESDLRTFRRLLPYNQVPYMRGLFDALEHGVNDALNLPRTRKRRKR